LLLQPAYHPSRERALEAHHRATSIVVSIVAAMPLPTDDQLASNATASRHSADREIWLPAAERTTC